MVRLKIKEVATAKGVSMSKLSRLSDVSYNTLLSIFHNPYHDVSIIILDRISQALHVPIWDLIEQTPDSQNQP
jgi:lambda repressor-like predicted transcriptional regulator